MFDLIAFRTKRDKSGNTYYIIMDLLRKTAKTGSNLGPAFFENSIELTKKGFDDLKLKRSGSGYEIIYI